MGAIFELRQPEFAFTFVSILSQSFSPVLVQDNPDEARHTQGDHANRRHRAPRAPGKPTAAAGARPLRLHSVRAAGQVIVLSFVGKSPKGFQISPKLPKSPK